MPRSARELRSLALAFNEMIERLDGKQRTLLREAEERIALERRLRETEAFAAVGTGDRRGDRGGARRYAHARERAPAGGMRASLELPVTATDSPS